MQPSRLGGQGWACSVGRCELDPSVRAYQERMDRHSEIAAVVSIESAKLETLQHRFDRLFSIGGEKRLISEQDQWIAPNLSLIHI